MFLARETALQPPREVVAAAVWYYELSEQGGIGNCSEKRVFPYFLRPLKYSIRLCRKEVKRVGRSEAKVGGERGKPRRL